MQCDISGHGLSVKKVDIVSSENVERVAEEAQKK